MTLPGPLRFSLKFPSSALARAGLFATLFLAAACATSAPRPPAPISTGEPRVPPERDLPTDRAEDIERPSEDELEEARKDGVTPPHMAGREIVRAAILLPFSHQNRAVRAEAEGLLAGVEMSLFDHGGDNFLLIPKDTAGKTSVAEAAAREALDEGADIILGPLFSANVQAVANVASRERVPVLAFSNDREAAGNNAFLASISPEEEVARIMQFARQRGVESFAFLGPQNDYGRRVEAAMRFEAAKLGGQMIASGFYSPANDAPIEEAAAVAKTVAAEAKRIPNRVAVLIPERGVKLRGVAPLLPYSGVDTRYVVMLGTSRWNDSSVWREPTLIGGFFPSPPQADASSFAQDYKRLYGRAPSGLAPLGYDAGAVAAALADEDGYDRRDIISADGFRGVNGVFRFLPDGTSQRGLAVMEITRDGAVEAEAGRNDFIDRTF